ncbi:MAG: sigma-70 domain-containing protein [Anaerostipes faecalis]|nr:sigma-70 domain-containing protein [Anaerostipes faecalis]
MDKNAFLKGMEEMLAVAKTNGNQITKEELITYFSDYSLDEEAQKLLFDSYVEAGIRVIGYEGTSGNSENEEAEEESAAIHFYEEELRNMDLPGEEEQKAMLQAWFQGEDNGDMVISCLLPAVVEIAKNHRGKGVLFADLIQEGNIGLLEAMAAYRGNDEEGFLRHARKAIEDSILDAIALQRGSDSVSQQMALKANRLDEASTHLSKELGREPKAEELADYLSMTVEEIKDIMKISLDALSVMETDITSDVR